MLFVDFLAVNVGRAEDGAMNHATRSAALLLAVSLGCAGARGAQQHAAGCDGRACGGYPNVALPTLGGRQLWADVTWDRGWRIQRHVWTGHHRLLDPGDVRRAWGGYAACAARLTSARATFDRPAPEHLVLLVHGLGRTRFSLAGLARDLRAAGLDTACVSYPSTRGTLEEHADALRDVVEHLAGVRRVSFVTHSLGGVVVRELLARDEPWRADVALGRVAMLAPPNRRVELAARLARSALFRWLAGPAGQQLARGEQERLPPPRVPTLVVAGGSRDGRGYNPLVGGDDDGVVAVRETRLAGAELLSVRGVHTFLMNDDAARRAVREFLGAAPQPSR
jgi:hypothetical protein